GPARAAAPRSRRAPPPARPGAAARRRGAPDGAGPRRPWAAARAGPPCTRMVTCNPRMNIQALSALLAALVTLAIGTSVVLRDRRRRTYRAFAAFTLAVALFHLFTFAFVTTNDPWMNWISFIPAALIPTSAIRFFRAFLSEPAIGGTPRPPRVTYVWTALWFALLIYGALVKPIHTTLWFTIPFSIYVFGGLYRCVYDLYVQYRATMTRVEK